MTAETPGAEAGGTALTTVYTSPHFIHARKQPNPTVAPHSANEAGQAEALRRAELWVLVPLQSPALNHNLSAFNQSI